MKARSGEGKYAWLLVVLFIVFGGVAHAQFYETINSGRPGQSVGAYTVGRGIFQIQSGFDSFGNTNNDAGTKNKGFLNSTGLRFGLTESFEVGAFFEYRHEEVTATNYSSSRGGLSNCGIGLRHQISAGNGLIPSVGFQFRLRLPVMSDYYKIDNVAPSFVFVTSQKLSNKFTLITNLGGAWNGTDATPIGTYTINLSCAFTDTFGAFIESYGSFTHGVFETRMDTGIAWLATRNLQLDLLGGFGRNNGLNDYFVSTGFSWRTRRERQEN
jgi:hypothetical protein